MDGQSVKALKYLIRVSPAGEIQDVLHHLSTLADGQDKLKDNADIVGQLRKYYEQHRYHIVLPNSKVGIVTTAGSQGNDDEGNFKYYDSILGLTFSFNAFTLAAQVVDEEKQEVPTSEFREELIKELTALTTNNQYYVPEKVLFSVNQQADEDHQIIEISVLNVNLPNYWSGEWQSTWTIQNGKLSGNHKVKSHYFEMGNMQFNLDKSYDSLAIKDAKDAKEIVKMIKAAEDLYQISLDDMWNEIQSNLLKKMRRPIPLHGNKFDWEKVPDILK